MYLDKWLTETKIDLSLKIRDIDMILNRIYNYSILQQSNRDDHKTYLYHLKPWGSYTGKLVKIDYNNKKLTFDCSEQCNSIFKTVEFSDIAEIVEIS